MPMPGAAAGAGQHPAGGVVSGARRRRQARAEAVARENGQTGKVGMLERLRVGGCEHGERDESQRSNSSVTTA